MSTSYAILLTDVVDSTRLSEERGDVAMAATWADHDRAARDLLVPWRGREIDKTDGFLLLFETAADAVGYALAYHRALGAMSPPLTARAGLHVGAVLLRENAPADVARGAKPLEVEGLAKPVAARVMALAGPGRTLLTAEARQALGERAATRVESHGHWRLKGLAEPVELFEVGEAEAPFSPPVDGPKAYRVVRDPTTLRWRPVRESPHQLPAERDAFVGRRQDLLALADALDAGARLVSVLGMGGAGKTRLVTAYAWTWLGDWPGGAWFCDLSEARDVEGIVRAVAAGIGVAAVGDGVARIGAVCAERGRCLVVLDNFEQVARHADATVGAWLDRAPEACFVVTTREVLGLPGEVSMALPPLESGDAVALFDQRARAAHRDYLPDPAAVSALVALLDHLPLAIELAAARVRMLPPQRLVERMSDRFRLLAAPGGRRDRQATLRATLDWSWELLTPHEQAGLAQLSVFAGGFGLDAVETVLAAGATDAPWPADVLQALIDKSLVRRVSDDRFDLLVTVQEYAWERARELGLAADAEGRHAAWCLTVRTSPTGPSALRERDNLWVACRRAADRGDGPLASELLGVAFPVLEKAGPLHAAAELAARVATLVEDAPGRAWRVHRWAALLWAARSVHQPEATRHAEASYAAATATADLDARVQAGNTFALRLALRDRLDEALALIDDLLRVVEANGDVDRVAMLLGNHATLAEMAGRPDLGIALAERGLGHARRHGLRVREASAQVRLARMYALARDFERARAAAVDAVRVADGAADMVWTALACAGDVESHAILAGEGDQGRVVAHRRELLAFAQASGTKTWRCEAGHLLAAALHDAGARDEARAIAGESLALATSLGRLETEARLLDRLGAIDVEQGRYDEAAARLELARRRFVDAAADGWAAIVTGRLALLPGLRGDADGLRRAREALAGHAPTGTVQRAAQGRVLAALDAALGAGAAAESS